MECRELSTELSTYSVANPKQPTAINIYGLPTAQESILYGSRFHSFIPSTPLGHFHSFCHSLSPSFANQNYHAVPYRIIVAPYQCPPDFVADFVGSKCQIGKLLSFRSDRRPSLCFYSQCDIHIYENFSSAVSVLCLHAGLAQSSSAHNMHHQSVTPFTSFTPSTLSNSEHHPAAVLA